MTNYVAFSCLSVSHLVILLFVSHPAMHTAWIVLFVFFFSLHFSLWCETKMGWLSEYLFRVFRFDGF